jgi:uncharacterized membrane protein
MRANTEGIYNIIGNIISSGSRLTLGQLQVVSVIAFLFLIPTAIIVAQNASIPNQSLELTGDLINTTEMEGLLEIVNLTKSETLNITGSITQENKTGNLTFFGNITETNQTADNITEEVFGNKTGNFTAPFNKTEPPEFNFSNKTEPGLNATPPEEEPEEEGELIGSLEIPEKIIRGDSYQLVLILENIGLGEAKDIHITFSLPYGHEIYVHESECLSLLPGEVCEKKVLVTTSLDADLGKEKMEVYVSYE